MRASGYGVARAGKKTAGEVLSALARNALTGRREAAGVRRPRAVCGFRPFPRRGSIVTNALVDSLRDGDVY